MSPDDPMGRLFIGIALSDDARAAIASHLAPLSPLPGRPGPPADWHVTLRFLGSTTRVQLERVLAGLSELPTATHIRFEGLGAFPRPQRATVLWLGVADPRSELEALADVAEEAAVAAGFAPQDRPFHAHMTLSRVRPPHDLRPLIEETPAVGKGMAVESMTLFRSQATSDGVRYHAVETLPLG